MARNRHGKFNAQRREKGGFFAFPHCALRSNEFISLSPYAIKLLMDLGSQYNGQNNGDLSIAWTLMKERGWKSKATLQKAKNELVAKQWIEVARQGGRHRCSLYALTFFAVDECNKKIDIAATHSPKGLWRTGPMPPIHPRRMRGS